MKVLKAIDYLIGFEAESFGDYHSNSIHSEETTGIEF